MSLRPRYASDGRLLLPEQLEIVDRDSHPGGYDKFAGRIGDRDWDPFERLSDELLLAESFARQDFQDLEAGRAWLSRHGVVEIDGIFPDPESQILESSVRSGRHRAEPEISETPYGIETHQRNVRWHLAVLAKLSEHRDAADPPAPGWAPHPGWDPRWAQPALQGENQDVLWLGGSDRFEAWILSPMQTHPTFRDHKPRGAPIRLKPPGVSERRFIEEWWPRAHAAWLDLRRIGQYVLWVPEEAWERTWSRYDADAAPDGRDPRGRLTSDWHGMLELQRRLIEPYVIKAAENQVGIQREMSFVDPAAGSPTVRWERRLSVREGRRWRSVLAPIYLQLLEALIRISEGQSGAAICKECRQPFLTLDARRSSFCNDKERFRYNQRQRRKRLAGEESEP